jgi:outer membrane receptor protein involved in Fe transport
VERALRPLAAPVALLAGLLLCTPPALAQGVTGSAVKGKVTNEQGRPVAHATVKLTNVANGNAFTAVTGESGDYFLDNVPPAETYALQATAESYQSRTQPDISLSLGQRLTIDVEMRVAFVEEVKVVSRTDSNADKGRTGGSSAFRTATLTKMPLQGRNFTDLASLDPRVVGSSFAGQNNRYNNIQIDGGVNNDIFGLAGNGTPGGQAGAKPISIEAIKEFVVQIAPFDVRQGRFAGGLINAITKSGTNEFHGSVFGYLQDKSLTRDYGGLIDTPYTYADYSTYQYGLTFSGPILEDKVHFFLATDLQDKSSSYSSPLNLTGDSATDIKNTGFDNASVQRFQGILNKYGIGNAGDASSPSLKTPDRNLFVKVTTNLLPDSNVELSYNFVKASADVFSRQPTSPSLTNLQYGWQLSNSGYSQANTTNTGRVKVTTSLLDGTLSNEFLGSLSFIRDARSLTDTAPLVLVKVGTIGASDSWLAAGAEYSSQANSLAQDIYQLQDNVTWAHGQHRVTVGTSNEFIHFRNVFLQAGTGAWAFNSLDAFASGTPAAFVRNLPVSDAQEAGVADFNVAQFAFYVQDEWSPIENLSLSPGVRVDVPFLSAAVANPVVLASTALPIDTSKIPTGNLLWSPRLGVNFDVDGTSDTVLRGGVGVFTGPPPYVFLSNAYSGNGLSKIMLSCSGATVPTFNPSAGSPPTACSGATGKPVPPTNQGEIDYFDPNTKYPQNLRFAGGVDQRLPFGLVGTADFMYARDINAFYTTDANLANLGTNGEGRAMYGTIATATGASTPTRLDNTNMKSAIEVFNKSGGDVTSATFQLKKAFGRRYSLTLAYNYSRSVDRMSFVSSVAYSNYRYAPIDGSLENRSVRPSAFDRPHRVVLNGAVDFGYGFSGGISYTGQSGLPYTWMINGDVNGDGVNGNDVPFIPADASQITLKDPKQYAALDAFIQGQKCLRDSRGTLLQRGACRNPWQDFLDVRFTWASPEVWKGLKAELQWDIFNVLNLVNPDWGHILSVTGNETASASFLKSVGYDTANQRPIYTFAGPGSIVNTTYSPTASRWRMQFGGRLLF